MKLFLLIWATASSTLYASASYADTISFEDIKTYERALYDRTITECDRLASHPSDPERVTEGVARQDMKKPAAIEACRAALKKDPDNPRLNYQLARAYGYSGLHKEGDPYRIAAVKAGYPQSLFVVGYIRVEGWDGRTPDPCYGGELIRRSAHAGRFAGLVGFPHYALTGRFEACMDYPAMNVAEMRGFLESAEARADGFYQSILVEQLNARLDEATTPLK